MHHFIHSVLVVMFLNSFVLFVAACMKTIPTEAASISAQLDNVPLRRMPVLNAQDDYSSHIQQFRQAKTFPSPQPTEPLATVDSAAASAASASTTDKTVDPPRISNREPSHAKTFAVKTDTRSEKSKIEEKTSRDEGSNNVHNDRDLFEALQVEKPDICGSCPPIWMKNTAEMKDICSNHESVSAFFSMTMDRRDAQNVVDSSDVKECTRTIVCSEPHMLVKWHESELCDVHAPSTGSLISDISNTFIYKCNGTQWTLHGFPLSSVVCAVGAS
ncbi:Glycoprotein [Caenorhabditis elegans]|uniref:Glycoprotein n=1 Tax=Caenorhabditis elegans TaxID=6239 RepID=Q9XXR8_CAEEL|nr:Glycoprotein [Caenorhabditis elegans]CAA16348.1 Glycoprotein [Caenorhabditis elegans]|eukprot:NP_502600.1 Uncharacterized protein CELE_Y38H8A.1 [Caenorhabditis elegans]